MVLFIVLAFILTILLIDGIVQYSRKKKSQTSTVSVAATPVFNESALSLPKGLYFDKTHTWAFMEQNGMVKMGIDDFILHITGSLSRIKLKRPGEKIQKGEPALSIIRYGKQLTINSPISGTVKSHNNVLLDDCSVLKTSPYGDGWIYTIEPSNWARDMKFLVMSDKYKDWLKNEFSRLKDFLSVMARRDNVEIIPVMLQDGGELKDEVLADFGPEIWEEFQNKFINGIKNDFGKSDSGFTIINI